MAKFTNKRKKELLENKYILTFAKDHIIYTETFRKKVILELSNGKTILQTLIIPFAVECPLVCK